MVDRDERSSNQASSSISCRYRKYERFVLPAILVILGVFSVLFWFRQGLVITGGDFMMPFDPGLLLKEIWSGWLNSQSSGGASSSNLLPMSPYLAFLFLGSWFGIPLNVVEITLFGAIIAMAGLSMWFLARRWMRNEAGCFTISVLYMLNPFVMIQFHNGEAIAIIAYSLAPTALLLVDVAFNEQFLPRWFWVDVGLLALAMAAPAAIPPTIIGGVILPALMLILLSLWSNRIPKARVRFMRLGVGCLVAVGVNLWWLIPSGAALLNGSIGAGFFKTVVSLAPPEAVSHISLFDEITGFGFWGWHGGYLGKPNFTFANSYSTIGMHFLVEVPLLLALLGALDAFSSIESAKRRMALFGFSMWATGFLLSYGFQGPLGIFQWFYFHFPVFEIFRSPWEDFSVLQTIGLALLAGLGVAALIKKHTEAVGSLNSASRILKGVHNYLYVGLMTVIAVAIVNPMFGSAFWSNKTFNGNLAYYVRLPKYVSEISSNVNLQKPCGIFFPEWNYQSSYSAYSFYQGGSINITDLFTCTVLAGTDTPTLRGLQVAVGLDNAISKDVPPDIVVKFLASLGVTDIIVPLDYEWSYYEMGPKPAELVDYFQRAAGAVTVHSFGPWIDFRINNSEIGLATSNIRWTETEVEKFEKDPMSYLDAFASAGANQNNGGISNGGNLLSPVSGVSGSPSGYNCTILRGRGTGIYSLVNVQGSCIVSSQNAFAPGWQLDLRSRSLGSSAPTIRHVEVNGFQNGWIFKGNGTYTVALVYQPKRWLSIGLGLSVLLSAVIVALGASKGKSSYDLVATAERRNDRQIQPL